MSDAVHDQWRKELRVLLDRIEHRPSSITPADRERVAVLQQLIASQGVAQAA